MTKLRGKSRTLTELKTVSRKDGEQKYTTITGNKNCNRNLVNFLRTTYIHD